MKNSVRQSTSFCRGFTLIEMSIVLVIIGLIVGSIFVGQDLIHAAMLRKVSGEYQHYEAAYNTFKLKYHCLPGNCAEATQIFGGPCPNNLATGNQTCNGSGNGRIWPYETRYVCQHLALAGLVGSGCGGGFPAALGVAPNVNALPSSYSDKLIMEISYVTQTAPYSTYFTAGNYLFFGGASPAGQYYPYGIADQRAGTSMVDAQAIDQKIDDGAPATGRLIQVSTDGWCGDLVNNVYQGTPSSYTLCLSYYNLGQ